jgi:hypothetical protein
MVTMVYRSRVLPNTPRDSVLLNEVRFEGDIDEERGTPGRVVWEHGEYWTGDVTRIPIRKLDSEEMLPLPGAVFEVERYPVPFPAGTYVLAITGADGLTEIDNDNLGAFTATCRFTLREVTSPDGFRILPGEIVFSIDPDNYFAVTIHSGPPGFFSFDVPNRELIIYNEAYCFGVIEFTKTDDSENPLSGDVLEDAEFRLYVRSGSGWQHVATRTSCDEGLVSFEPLPNWNGLTSPQFRLVESQAPDDFITPEIGDHWYIVMSRDDEDNPSKYSITRAGDAPNVAYEEGWFIGNEPEPPISLEFSIQKANQQFLASKNSEGIGWTDVNNYFLLEGAQFRLYRYTGDSTPASELLPPGSVASPWYANGVGTSTGQGGSPMNFTLSSGYRYFQLMEVVAPAGFELPTQQWRLTLAYDMSSASGWELLSDNWWVRVDPIGSDSGRAPAFVRQPANSGEDGAGAFYIGNISQTDLPFTGGTSRLGLVIAALGFISIAFTVAAAEHFRREGLGTTGELELALEQG